MQDKSDTTYMIFGALLMVVYLAVDGLTSTWQDGMFRTYNMGICDQVREGEEKQQAWALREEPGPSGATKVHKAPEMHQAEEVHHGRVETQ